MMGDHLNKSIKDFHGNVSGNINIADFIINISTQSTEGLTRLTETINQAFGNKQFNKIDIDGDNNIVFQDVKAGDINIEQFVAKITEEILQKIFLNQNIKAFNGREIRKDALYVLVMATDQISLKQQFTSSAIENLIDFDDYGTSLYQWKPYTNEASIFELLAQYKIFSGFEIIYLDLSKILGSYRDFCTVCKQIVLIPDCLSLINNSTFDRVIKTANEQQVVPSLLIPMCSKKPSGLIACMRKESKERFPFYHELYAEFKNLDTEYAQIELELPTKQDFFRKLTNIAKLKLKIGNQISTADPRLNEMKSELGSQNDLMP